MMSALRTLVSMEDPAKIGTMGTDVNAELVSKAPTVKLVSMNWLVNVYSLIPGPQVELVKIDIEV